MTKKSEVAVIDFTKFSIAQLPELNGKKEEIKAVIKANPVIEVTDNASYELAKKSRTAVRTLRTSLQGEKTEVVGRIKKNVLEVVANEYDSLIADVKNDENARQEHVTVWEEKKEAERLEKLRLEELRIKNIKDAIQGFKDAWIETIERMLYEGIGSARQHFLQTVNEFPKEKLAEFEVLFDDAVVYLKKLMESRIDILEEQEQIRIQQIELAKEKERQRLEFERLKKEQEALVEKQRIAQEKFQKEKAEFEAKQAEAKFQERKKQLLELGMIDDGKERLVFENWEFRYAQIKDFDEPNYQESLEFVGQKIAESKEPKSVAKEVMLEEPKTDEIAEENYHEDDVHEIAKNDSVTLFEIPDKELTWDSLYDNFKNSIEFKKCTANTLLAGFFNYLQNNYEVPQPKNKS